MEGSRCTQTSRDGKSGSQGEGNRQRHRAGSIISKGQVVPNTPGLLGYLFIPDGGKSPGSEIQNRQEAELPDCGSQCGMDLWERLPGRGQS